MRAAWLVLFTGFAVAEGADLQALYDAKDWFGLRDAVTNESPSLYRGAVAAAFQDVERAERLLAPLHERQPDSDAAHEARGLLINLYHRASRFHYALRLVEESLEHRPDAADLKIARTLFASFAKRPDQRVVQRRRSRIPYSRDDMLTVPLEINGRKAEYFVDTGSGVSILAASEAARLGMRVDAVAVEVGTTSGAPASFSTAVADRLQIGGVALENVAFLVARDDQMPFVELPQEQRGGLGLPALLAIGGFRWNADGALEVGFPAERKSIETANLCFDGDKPITLVGFRGRRLPVVLDSGAGRTVLLEPFAKDFEALLAEIGEKGSTRMTGVAGSADIASITLPRLVFELGGVETVLEPAPVLLEPTVGHSNIYYANLGVDLLYQARTATIDFGAMRLTLER